MLFFTNNHKRIATFKNGAVRDFLEVMIFFRWALGDDFAAGFSGFGAEEWLLSTRPANILVSF